MCVYVCVALHCDLSRRKEGTYPELCLFLCYVVCVRAHMYFFSNETAVALFLLWPGY